jgi:hypothetical protein
MVPIRFIFRSRWAALFWAAGICWSAVEFAGERKAEVDAANVSDTNVAQASALLAEGN